MLFRSSTLDVWDGHLARTGAALLAGRLDLVAGIAPYTVEAFAEVAPTSDPIALRYRSSVPGELPASPAELEPLLLDRSENNKVTNKKTGEEFELDFSRCVLTTTLRDVLEDVAGRDFGDAQQPNLKHGIKSFRNKFHP